MKIRWGLTPGEGLISMPARRESIVPMRAARPDIYQAFTKNRRAQMQRARSGGPFGKSRDSLYYSSDFIAAPRSAGDRTVLTPAASSAVNFSSAVPLPPEMMAPAWPMRLPAGAVTPAI